MSSNILCCPSPNLDIKFETSCGSGPEGHHLRCHPFSASTRSRERALPRLSSATSNPSLASWSTSCCEGWWWWDRWVRGFQGWAGQQGLNFGPQGWCGPRGACEQAMACTDEQGVEICLRVNMEHTCKNIHVFHECLCTAKSTTCSCCTIHHFASASCKLHPMLAEIYLSRFAPGDRCSTYDPVRL